MSNNTTNPCILYGQDCTSPTNLPSFIDTSACLCGLLTSREPPFQGQINEKWRCIGNASANITAGGNGKWYNTSLPSEELSGINQPQNWGENPPDLSQVFVLNDVNGQPLYQKLTSNDSTALIGADTNCTGRNSTDLSTKYYAKGKGASIPASLTSSSASSTSSMASGSGASSGSSATPTASPSSGSASSGSSSGSSTAPSSTSSSKSDAPGSNLKAMFLVAMVLAPLVTLMA